MDTGDKNAVTDGTQQHTVNNVSSDVNGVTEVLPMGKDTVNIQSNEIFTTDTMVPTNTPIVNENRVSGLSVIDSNVQNAVTASETGETSEATTSSVATLNEVTENGDRNGVTAVNTVNKLENKTNTNETVEDATQDDTNGDTDLDKTLEYPHDSVDPGNDTGLLGDADSPTVDLNETLEYVPIDSNDSDTAELSVNKNNLKSYTVTSEVNRLYRHKQQQML